MSYATNTIFKSGEVSAGQIETEIKRNGSIIIQNVLLPDFVEQMKIEIELAIDQEVAYHKTKNYKDYGMVMLCAMYGGTFISILDNDQLLLPFNTMLGDGCIIYAYTSSSMPPSASNYSNRIHVDCPRLIPEYITNMGATILLDDFTEENGATWYLPKSQHMGQAPSEEDFYKNGSRVIAPAGSVWFFNARVWHAGGQNKTLKWRHAVTLNVCRSFMKQRIDIPRAIHELVPMDAISENAKQKLGFYTQVPASLDEYYLPPDQRKFRQKAE
jgi:ectoine hydroxylase-related dioxygenase (phytanoyl-CoA dioxygenase family)